MCAASAATKCPLMRCSATSASGIPTPTRPWRDHRPGHVGTPPPRTSGRNGRHDTRFGVAPAWFVRCVWPACDRVPIQAVGTRRGALQGAFSVVVAYRRRAGQAGFAVRSRRRAVAHRPGNVALAPVRDGRRWHSGRAELVPWRVRSLSTGSTRRGSRAAGFHFLLAGFHSLVTTPARTAGALRSETSKPSLPCVPALVSVRYAEFQPC